MYLLMILNAIDMRPSWYVYVHLEHAMNTEISMMYDAYSPHAQHPPHSPLPARYVVFKRHFVSLVQGMRWSSDAPGSVVTKRCLWEQVEETRATGLKVDSDDRDGSGVVGEYFPWTPAGGCRV
jgi:hypothetical protein